MSNKLKFYRGLESLYNAVTHADGVFFATDTHKIYMNGAVYGGSDDTVITDVAPKEGDSSKIVVTFSDGTTKDVAVGKTTYTSGIEDVELDMPNAVGGIAKNTKVKQLNGKSYDAMFDDLLFPTINPTFTAPSASLSLKSGQAATRYVGSAAPAATDFNLTLNKGAITLNGTTQASRAGDSESSIIYYGGNESNTALPTTVALGDTKYKGKIHHAAGPQPKNNKGGNYSSPLPEGDVSSNEVTVNGTYPWYASTVTTGTLTEQNKINWNGTVGGMTTPATKLKPVGTGAQTFKLPRKMQSFTQLNTLSGNYEAGNKSEWTETTVEDATYGITYYIYTFNGDPRGEVTLIIKF